MAVMRASAFSDMFGARHELLTSHARFDGPVHVTSLLDAPLARLAELEVLLTGWDAPRLTREVLELLPRLRAVIHCGGTVRGIVSDDLWRRNILLTSLPDTNAVPVAEFTFASIVLAGKRAHVLASRARAMRADWSYVSEWGPIGNVGRIIGVVGFSRIGKRVVQLVQNLTDVTCLVVDPYARPDDVALAGGRLVGLEEMLPVVDTLSLHAPATPETYHLIGAGELALLRDHTTLINTARGTLVDTAALEAECATGRIHALLDVTDPEPLPHDSPLYDLPNVTITPHIAGSMGSEMALLADAAVAQLAAYSRGEKLPGRVDRATVAISA
mgnify:CR=1 FL=1|jgi:Phosphoglycerate dehydrogenase and related dehydrogenases